MKLAEDRFYGPHEFHIQSAGVHTVGLRASYESKSRLYDVARFPHDVWGYGKHVFFVNGKHQEKPNAYHRAIMARVGWV